MGGTAIGTGLNAPPGFSERCTAHLATITGMPIRLAKNLVEATQDTQAFVLYSSVLKSLSIKASKICNDLRLLSSGPRAGTARDQSAADAAWIVHHAGQKNPVIPEVVNRCVTAPIGNDLTVTMAAEAGSFN